MKPILLALLCGSLVMNVVLLVKSPKAEAQPEPVEVVSAPPPAPAAPEVLDDALWQKLVSGDPNALEKIRHAGFSPELIRALLRAAIMEQFKAREEAMYRSGKDAKYWDSNYTRGLYTPKDRVALLDLRREREKLLDQWIPGWREEDNRDDRDSAILGPEKARQARLVEEDFNALIGNIRNAYNGMPSSMLPADREKIQYLQKERRSELAEILTPQELEEYDLRESSTANSLRFGLAAFDATEQEFRGIFKIQKTVDDRFSAEIPATGPELRAARQQAQDAADAQIKSLLGEQRYAEYTRAKDRDYKAFAAIADHMQLAPDRAAEAYRIKTELTQKMDTAMSSGGDGRAELLSSLNQEAEREFTRVLGAKGYEVYKQYGELPRRMTMYLNMPKPPPKPKG